MNRNWGLLYRWWIVSELLFMDTGLSWAAGHDVRGKNTMSNNALVAENNEEI